jgi:hypothetical protein
MVGCGLRVWCCCVPACAAWFCSWFCSPSLSLLQLERLPVKFQKLPLHYTISEATASSCVAALCRPMAHRNQKPPAVAPTVSLPFESLSVDNGASLSGASTTFAARPLLLPQFCARCIPSATPPPPQNHDRSFRFDGPFFSRLLLRSVDFRRRR